MAFTINTNITSMQAQEYLRVTGDFQSKTINRVTSGLRIVSSGDDAAGLAIANGFRSDQAVLSQGIRNANDGLATLQTIDGGITNISKLLDRARSLAAQSASGTFNGDRAVLDEEFSSVLSEIDRQAQAIGLNSGGKFAKDLSVFIGGGRTAAGDTTGSGAITNGSVSVDLTTSTVDSRSLGLSGFTVDGVTDLDNAATFSTAKGAATSTTLSFMGAGYSGANAIGITVNLNGVNDLNGLVDSINAGIAAAASGNSTYAAAFKDAGIRAEVSADGKSFSLTSSSAAFSVYDGGAAGAARNFLGTTGTDYVKVGGGLQTKNLTWTNLGNTDSQVATVSVVGSDGALNKVDITIDDGVAGSPTDIDEAIADINAQLQASNNAELRKLVAVKDDDNTTITFVSPKEFNITLGTATSAAVGLGVAAQGTTVASAQSGTGGTISIGTQASAEAAITSLANAVVDLGAAQAVVGKAQNQFNYAVSLASTQLTNLAASESRIRDADLALEAANLTKAQILQQAGIAAMAQANSAPQAVLSLLRG